MTTKVVRTCFETLFLTNRQLFIWLHNRNHIGASATETFLWLTWTILRLKNCIWNFMICSKIRIYLMRCIYCREIWRSMFEQLKIYICDRLQCYHESVDILKLLLKSFIASNKIPKNYLRPSLYSPWFHVHLSVSLFSNSGTMVSDSNAENVCSFSCSKYINWCIINLDNLQQMKSYNMLLKNKVPPKPKVSGIYWWKDNLIAF